MPGGEDYAGVLDLGVPGWLLEEGREGVSLGGLWRAEEIEASWTVPEHVQRACWRHLVSSAAAVSSMSAVVTVVHVDINRSNQSSKQGIRGCRQTDNNEQLRRVQ